MISTCDLQLTQVWFIKISSDTNCATSDSNYSVASSKVISEMHSHLYWVERIRSQSLL